MTDLNPELIAKATKALVADEFVLCRTHNATADDDLGHLTCSVCHARARTHARAALEAVADDLRAEGAAQALEDARDAGATELLKLLIAEDDAQYIGGSSHGMGPIEACEIAEGWLDARAAKLRGADQ